MSLPARLKEQYLSRLDELIDSGSAMPMKQHSSVASRNVLSGEVRYRHYDLASWPDFVEWRTSCIAVLDLVVPKTSLLRKTVDGFHTLGSDPQKVEFATSFLRSVRKELESGSLVQLARQIEAEVLSDYLGQAEALMSGSSVGAEHVAAAVVAGAALERGLRSLCDSQSPQEPTANENGAPLGMAALIDALKRREVYNELQAKELRSWSALRNAAAHGQFESFSREQVNGMVTGISRFLREYAGLNRPGFPGGSFT